ncbi:MAG: tetraacyldisaccharide 4'-kinase [Neptuniibacter sp.]
MSWLEKRWYSDKPAPFWLLPMERLYRYLAIKAARKSKQNSWQAPVPLIIVGNISVGGTGKTPLVVSLVALLRERGYKPGIISRGYKSTAPQYPYLLSDVSSAEDAGDEPYLLYKRCKCPVVIDPDRRAAAQLLLKETDCDLIISDDGLQHYRLQRDIEIVVVDGERGLGNEHCLPAGPLRETADRLKSVDYIVTNGPLCKPLIGIDTQLVQQMVLVPSRFVNCRNPEKELPVDVFKGQTVHALAGIGNPERFFNALQEYSSVEIIRHAKPDHCVYQSADICFDDELPVLMTEKDSVKIEDIAGDEHWYLEVSATLPDNFISQLQTKLETVKEHKGNLNNG